MNKVHKRTELLYKMFRVSLVLAFAKKVNPEKVFNEKKIRFKKMINGVGFEFPDLGVKELAGVYGTLKQEAVKILGREIYDELTKEVDVTYMTKSMEITKELIKEDDEKTKRNEDAVKNYINAKANSGAIELSEDYDDTERRIYRSNK